jgi:hypothetical protein
MARARPEISIITSFRFLGRLAFASRLRAHVHAASAMQVPISASSCMGCGRNMSMAIHRTAGPPQGFRRAWLSIARRDFIQAKGSPGMNGRNTVPARAKAQPTISPTCRARESIVIPTPFAAPKEEQTWTPVDIARAFIAANPRLRPGMLGVACASSVLQEVRICFSKDLRDFHACPEVSRQGCRVREVSVPPVL